MYSFRSLNCAKRGYIFHSPLVLQKRKQYKSTIIMPRIGIRTPTIVSLANHVKYLEFRYRLRSLLEEDDFELDMIYEHYLNALRIISGRRYLLRNVYRFRQIDLSFSGLNDDEFLCNFRLTRSQFNSLSERLKLREPFKSQYGSNIGRPSRSVEMQLIVFLYRVGQTGSSASDINISSALMIGKGTVAKYVKNVITALNSMKDEVIPWPTESERREMKNRVGVLHGFKNCIGIIDGTLIPLEARPTKDHMCYFSRKCCYCIVVLIVCDDRAKITYIYGGWPGGTHDNRVWRNSKLQHRKEEYFANREYLLGDSAFSSGSIMVQPFKHSPGRPKLPPEEEFFNTALGSLRVKSEHCIGILKNRFPCLKKLNVLVTGRREVKHIMDLLGACAVIHNLLIEDKDSIPQHWYDNLSQGTDWTTDGEIVDDIDNDHEVDRRDEVFKSIIEYFY